MDALQPGVQKGTNMKTDRHSLNTDLSRRVSVDTQAMDWTQSPGGHVLRKRVHLSGLAESGQVTSVVRYKAGARFPAHDHPGGEEILVLDGVFSDEHGNWPEGTYLLNPEGFRHGPFSEQGCTLFVKLRQFPAGIVNTLLCRQTICPGLKPVAGGQRVKHSTLSSPTPIVRVWNAGNHLRTEVSSLSQWARNCSCWKAVLAISSTAIAATVGCAYPLAIP